MTKNIYVGTYTNYACGYFFNNNILGFENVVLYLYKRQDRVAKQRDEGCNIKKMIVFSKPNWLCCVLAIK